ncbi:hypothetical protein [uncultured Gemmiger sp.]|uniref:hypothetical protein n=1 Tax=uncultured Gemmiger sp. TaxID=1623490 RepID=UPI002667173A|nr:hypothetical protein [uncultured Gemmiger sp.]
MKGIQSNGFLPIIAQAIAEMEETHGEFSSIDEVNLAELGRRTGLSRSKLRRLKRNGFCEKLHGLKGQKKEHILDGYSSVLDALLKSGVSNSKVCLERLQAIGFTGSQSTVKRYTLLCTLDRIFDDATVFKLRGESFRGKKLETVSLQTGKIPAVESVMAKE